MKSENFEILAWARRTAAQRLAAAQSSAPTAAQPLARKAVARTKHGAKLKHGELSQAVDHLRRSGDMFDVYDVLDALDNRTSYKSAAHTLNRYVALGLLRVAVETNYKHPAPALYQGVKP